MRGASDARMILLAPRASRPKPRRPTRRFCRRCRAGGRRKADRRAAGARNPRGGRRQIPGGTSQLMHLLADGEFWVLLAVLVFAAVVWKPMRRTVIGALDERAARIRAELDEARQLREEAEQLLAQYQQRQREAAADAEAIVAHAREEAERIAAQSARDLDAALARRQRLAEERIAQAEQKALEEIRAVAVDIAIGAAREVIVAQIDEERGAALLDAAIAALPQRLR